MLCVSKGVVANCVHALQGIADEMEGKVSVVKIDTDKYPNIASRYGIKVCTCCVCCYRGSQSAKGFGTGWTSTCRECWAAIFEHYMRFLSQVLMVVN